MDSLDTPGISGGSANTSSLANTGGSTNGATTQAVADSISGGASTTGGAATSVGVATGGSSVARSATGGFATGGIMTSGGVATGGFPASGGAATGGSSAARSTTGGSATGGVSASGGAATGGAPSGGAAMGGTEATGGVATGGTAATGGTTSGGTTVVIQNACPSPITKPANLIAAEPKPVDPCARVSNVITYNAGKYAYGFTNGEVYVFDALLLSARQVDFWLQSGVKTSLPRALVTAQYSPAGNSEGALEVGYADPDNIGLTPWYAGTAGSYWMAGSANPTGTVLGISACPFHAFGGHLELTVPWAMEESVVNSYTFSSANVGTLNLHLQLVGGGYVTSIATITTSNGWQVIAGTEAGEIYLSNLLSGSVTWNDTTQTLSKPVTWARITDGNMPAKWVTRIAVHPTLPDRILVTFASDATDAVWYSANTGQTWSNRHANLPMISNATKAPPVIGASFNPLVDGAAYVVTPQTSYYTLDYGATKWLEW